MNKFKYYLVTFSSILTLIPAFVISGPTTAVANEKSVIYGTAEGGTKLVAIDLKKKKTTVIGPIGFPGALPLAFSLDGTAYTMVNVSTDVGVRKQLATIDLETGAATLIGSPVLENLMIMGIGFAPDGTLYAAGDTMKNLLYTIDLVTGQATLVGPFGVQGFIMSFAVGLDGHMYAASVSALYRVDLSTGEATKVVDFIGACAVMGIAFDRHGRLYAADFKNLPPGSSLYRVDLQTGFTTPVLNTGIANIHNIAFKPK